MSRRSGGGLTSRISFSPHVVVFGLTAVLVFFPLRETVGVFVYWLYGASYRPLDFVITELAPNDGWPIARGRLEPGGEEWVLEVEEREGRSVVTAAPELAAAPGVRIPVWWSDEAPTIGFGPGRSTKIVPRAARPVLPGFGQLLFWSACTLAVLWLGLQATFRTARWAQKWRT